MIEVRDTDGKYSYHPWGWLILLQSQVAIPDDAVLVLGGGFVRLHTAEDVRLYPYSQISKIQLGKTLPGSKEAAVYVRSDLQPSPTVAKRAPAASGLST